MKTATATVVSPSPLLSFASVAAMLDRPPDKAARLYFYRGARNGTFPAPIRVGAAKIMWRRSDIEAFISSRQPVLYAPENAQ